MARKQKVKSARRQGKPLVFAVPRLRRTWGLRLSTLAALLLGTAFPGMAQELPTAPVVVAGDVTVSATPGQMEVGQGSQYGIVNWGSFGIGAGAGVHFANGAGATLNRVTGGDASAILGNLTATGSVYLVNPNGIVVGANGVVDTGGRFVASTLDVSDADFLDGGDLTFSGAGGVVVNLGKVGSSGGDVALIAGDVVNEGSLSAPDGTVGLAAGRQVLMRDAAVDEGMFSVLVGSGDVTDKGAIQAAAAELRAKGGNVYALAGNTESIIAATGVEKVKGRVFLTAGPGKVVADKTVTAKEADGKGGRIEVTGGDIDLAGSLQASGTEGGFVKVKADNETNFTGMIQTLGGGFVELSGGHISFDGSIDMGGGTLLIDPRNIEINNANSTVLSNSTVFTTSDISTLLAAGDVILDTSTSPTADAGTIAWVSGFSYTSASSLTLLAAGDIWILSDVQNSGSGALTAVAGWDGSTGFDSSFDTADLTSTTLFGQAGGLSYDLGGSTFTTSGSVFVGRVSNALGSSFGSKNGATGVYGASVNVTGGTTAALAATNPYAQIGYHTTGGGDFGTVDGAVTVRATGDITLAAGTGFAAYAQIGHGGVELGGDVSTPTALMKADILVQAGGNLSLQGGASSTNDAAYAMIGQGTMDTGFAANGDRTGAVTLNVGGELSLQEGGAFTNGTWVGQRTGTGTISAAPVTITAAQMDQSASSTVGSGGLSVVNIRNWADYTHSDAVRIALTDSDLQLTGDTTLIDAESQSITSDHDLVVQTSGKLTLDSTFQYGNNGAGGLVLAGASVDNQRGSDAFLAVGGGWYVYSTRPDQDSGLLGTVVPDGLSYGVSYSGADTHGPSAALGNVIYYSVTPTVVTDDQTSTYGNTGSPNSHVQVGGLDVDAATFGFFLSPQVDGSAVTFSGSGFVNAGTYANALFASVDGAGVGTITGYGETRGTLTVDPATLTVSLDDETKTYDGSGLYTGAVSYSGFVEGENDTLVTTGPGFAYAGGDGSGVNAGTYTVTASGAVESSGNYVFDYTDTAALTIDQALLSVSLADQSKVYDAVGGYDGTVTYSGFVGSDTSALITGGPSYLYDEGSVGGVNVGSYTVSASGATESSGNYAFDYSDFATLTITPATLSVVLADQSKTYDAVGGYDGAVSFTGFQGSDDASLITTGPGFAYAGGDQSGVNAGSYTVTASGAAESSGNYTFDYTDTAALTITPAVLSVQLGDQSKVYDAVGLYSGAVSYSGFQGSDSASLISTGPGFSYSGGAVNVGSYTVTASGAAESSGNYTFDYTDTATLAITPAVLTVLLADQTKTYDGVGGYTGAVSYTGFQGSDTAALITAGPGFAYAGGDGSGVNAGAYTVTGAGGAESSGNYTFDYADTASLTIDPALLTVSFGGTITKTYDGTTSAILTAGDFVISGFVAGEGGTITQTAGTHSTAHAGATTVSADLTGAFALNPGTSLLNYSVPVLVSGAGQIDAAQLVVTIVGRPTRPFDGSVDTKIGAGNYSVAGLVGGDSVTITQTAATYDLPDAGNRTLTADLTLADYAAGSGTDLTNYAIDTQAVGPGRISLARTAVPPEVTPRPVAPTEVVFDPEPPGNGGSLEVIDTETTGRIVEDIKSGTNFCRQFVGPEFAIDCLSDRLQSVADGLSATGEYSEVRAVLEDAAAQLHALAVQNASDQLSRSIARATDGTGRTSGRPLTAVDPSKLVDANAEAAAIIANTQLVLLRSAANSDRRRVAFTQVGQVLGTTTVLLRS